MDGSAYSNSKPYNGEACCGEAKTPFVEDPWQHRSKGMKCKTCMWFVMKQEAAHTDARGALGRCRKHAPTMGGFPAVFTEDWCGDHKLDETKL